MVWIQTDEGSLIELSNNGQAITIGRGLDNDVHLDWKAVSKLHAKVLTVKDNSGDCKSYIEDCESRNGTFVGHNPFDMEKVSGKTLLNHNDYIQFGSSKKYFRYFTIIPESISDKMVSNISHYDAQENLMNIKRDNKSSFKLMPILSEDKEEFPDELTVIPAQITNRIQPNSSHSQSKTIDESPLNDHVNRNVTITYPASSTGNINPVTIHIDGSGKFYNSSKLVELSETRNNDFSRKRESDVVRANESLGHSDDYLPSTFVPSDGNIDRNYASMNSSFKHNIKLDVKTSEGLNTSHFKNMSLAAQPSLSSPVNSKEYINFANKTNVSQSFVVHEDQNYKNESKISQSGNKENIRPIVRRKYANEINIRPDVTHDISYYVRIILGMEFEQSARVGKALDLVEDYGWNDIEKLADHTVKSGPVKISTKDSYDVSQEHNNNINESDLIFTIPELLPPELLAEALADMMNNENSINSLLNSVLESLNDVFEQMYQGMQIDNEKDKNVPMEIDEALQSFTQDLINKATTNIDICLRSNLMKEITSLKLGGFTEKVYLALLISRESLDRITRFQLGTFPSRTKVSQLSQFEKYEISYMAMDYILQYIDTCNSFIAQICDKAESNVLMHSSISRHVSTEINNIRKMKSQQSIDLKVSSDKMITLNNERSDSIKKLVHSTYGKSLLNRLAYILKSGHSKVKRALFYKWKRWVDIQTIREAKMYRLLGALDDSITLTKKTIFKIWKNYSSERMNEYKRSVALKRVMMIIAQSHRRTMLQTFSHWRSVSFAEELKARDPSTYYEQKLYIYSLEAKLRDLLDTDTNARALFAEKALNREITDINISLRKGMEEQRVKLLSKWRTATKRKPNLSSYIDREVELAEARRQISMLKEMISKKPSSRLNSNVNMAENDTQGLRDDIHKGEKAISRIIVSKKDSINSEQQALSIVLHEIRRLQISLDSSYHEIDEAHTQMSSYLETISNQRTAIQDLEKRISLQNRASKHLMAILRDKMDDKELVEIIDALEEQESGSSKNFVESLVYVEDGLGSRSKTKSSW